jgi:hypothetical protein
VKKFIKSFLPLIDLLLMPLVYISAIVLKSVRRAGVQRMPFCKRALLEVGVFPIRNHYYEPQFDTRDMKPPLFENRHLPGINWNVPGQLSFLQNMKFSDELNALFDSKPGALSFTFNNGSFESGDAEFWYQLIRSVKPKRIIEVGSGNSTLIAISALKKNMLEDSSYQFSHTCIEPYEMPWLEDSGVTLLRKKVEDVDLSFFSTLEENDILFIDSSHVIRPQGDVLFEYLELLPTLKKGVIVHIHDIFSPRNYLKKWIQEEVRLWNEQYILEAFLTHNDKWEIIASLNHLQHNHHDSLKAIAPFLTPHREPCSFYIRKIS